MRFAVSQYQMKLDNAPCMKTVLRSFVSPDNGEFVRLRADIRLLLPGNGRTEARAKLEKQNPEFVNWFNKIWDLRKTHMVPNSCNKYFFALKACGDYKNCIHPLCRNQTEFNKWNQRTWYSGGPTIGQAVWPVPDPEKLYANTVCTSCVKPCSGHYLIGEKAVQVALQEPERQIPQPPDEKLKETINHYLDKIGHDVDDEHVTKWASEYLLHENLVKWAIGKEKARRVLTTKRSIDRLEKARAKSLAERLDRPMPAKFLRKR